MSKKNCCDLNLGESLNIYLLSGLYLLNGFDFDFDLFWIAWHWKPAIDCGQLCLSTHPSSPPSPPSPPILPSGNMRTATGSELFSLSTCPHTTTFTLLCIFSPLEMSSIKIWEKIWVLAREIFFSGCRPRLKNKCTHMIEWQFFCHKTSHWNGYSTDQVCPEKLILVIIETNYCLITGTRLYVTNDQVSWMIRLSRRIFRETSRIGAAKQGAQVIVNYRSCVENNQI